MSDIEIDRLRARIAELERVLSWYADEARALAKHVEARAHTTGVLASVTVLALDGGRNADELLKDKPTNRPHLSLPALQRLGARLAELLDEDQWAECEWLLQEAGVTPPLPKATKP